MKYFCSLFYPKCCQSMTCFVGFFSWAEASCPVCASSGFCMMMSGVGGGGGREICTLALGTRRCFCVVLSCWASLSVFPPRLLVCFYLLCIISFFTTRTKKNPAPVFRGTPVGRSVRELFRFLRCMHAVFKSAFLMFAHKNDGIKANWIYLMQFGL